MSATKSDVVRDATAMHFILERVVQQWDQDDRKRMVASALHELYTPNFDPACYIAASAAGLEVARLKVIKIETQ